MKDHCIVATLIFLFALTNSMVGQEVHDVVAADVEIEIDPNQQPAKLPLEEFLEKEHKKLLARIKHTEKQLKQLKEKANAWENWKAEFQKEALKDKHRMTQEIIAKEVDFEVVDHPAVVAEPSKKTVSLEYENVTWQHLLDKVVRPMYDFEIEDYPEGTVSFQGFPDLSSEQAMTVINWKLEKAGYGFWKAINGNRVVRYLPDDHPLIGKWKIKRWMADGKEDSHEFKSMTILPTSFTLAEADDAEAYQFTFATSGQDLYWVYQEDPDDPAIIGLGSFHVDGNQATMLLALPDDDEPNATEGVILVKLLRGQ